MRKWIVFASITMSCGASDPPCDTVVDENRVAELVRREVREQLRTGRPDFDENDTDDRDAIREADTDEHSHVPVPSIPAPEDVSGPPPSAERTPTGLASRVLRSGPGTRHPTADSHIEVHYSGWTTDGQLFDSSVERGQTATFPLRGLIEGWREGIPLMVEGETRRFWIPEDLAYRGREPHGMLVFDVELIRILD